MLFEIVHHGTRIDDDGFAESFYNPQIVEAFDAEALVQWASEVLFPIRDRKTFDPATQAVSIATFAPTRILKNTSTLEGSSKWMTGGTGGTSALWSTDNDPGQNAAGVKYMQFLLEDLNA